jgi:hypothetical protein
MIILVVLKQYMKYFDCTLSGTTHFIPTKKKFDVVGMNILVAGAGLEPATFGL